MLAASAAYVWVRGLTVGEPFSMAALLRLWEEIAPFLVLFALHHYLAAPFLLHKKPVAYVIAALLLLGLFALWCFTLGRHVPDFPGGGAPPPPQFGPEPDGPVLGDPGGFGGLEGSGSPDGFSGPGGFGGPGLWGPELTRIIIALMMILADLGIRANFRAAASERKVQGLEAELESISAIAELESAPEDLIFKSPRKTVAIPIASVVYVESMSEYIKFHLDGAPEPVVLLGSLKKLMDMLPEDRFIRIHRSYIVATSFIRETSPSGVILEGGARLPVSETYRPALKQWVEKA